MESRKKFEEEAMRRAQESEYSPLGSVLKRAGDGYATTWVDMMWEGWKAAMNSIENHTLKAPEKK
ncbi:hypothetical protein CHU32_09650 [Superficieibacter electus]|uniref:Uncharacterized protein n=1 Tax=Superficieibacter electus TaxID=2022662 RepID=A0A2P5GQK8_9ENTR|nr:hypothetical protein CHU33_15765 [Superficieibacter electus]POP48853.1 hypothetical protein CHU32_09650 [Superficieibacter electus]